MSQSVNFQQRYELNFLNSIRSEATKKYYQFYFKKYTEFVKGNLIVADTRILESQIIDFLVSLKSRGLTYDSTKCYLYAIAHFYTMNDIVLNRKKIVRFIDTDERKMHKNQGYTSEQIQKLLDVCDERMKAVILLYCSSGIRLGALHALKIGDCQLVEDLKLFRITVYQGYNEEYITFCTPECRKVIDSYLEYRLRCGEELSNNAPLIREQFNASDSFRVKHPKPISLKTITKTLRLKAVQAGIIKVNHISGTRNGSKYRKDIPLIHGFRKFFNTALMNADVNLRFKELLMGHTIKLDDVYYDKNSKKSQDKLLDEYSKAIDYLTINEENRLKQKVEMLTIRADKIQQLEAAVDKLQSQYLQSKSNSF